MLKGNGNHLSFQGDVRGDLFSVSAALHNMIHKSGYQDIVLDFSQATSLPPRLMLPVVTIARSYRSENVDFEIVLPSDTKLAKLMHNANWLHLIHPERYESRSSLNQSHFSARQYRNGEEHSAVVNQCLDLMLRRLSNLDRSHLKALEWSLNEITDNVLNHSESNLGGVLQAVLFPTRGLVEFYVCDVGIGIPKSLRRGRADILDDVSALRHAIEEGVTRNKNTNQGNGLFGSFKCCAVSGGEFTLVSGNAWLEYGQQNLRASRSSIPFGGTFVRACINYTVEGLLERALVFRGKPHIPSFDFIERSYQSLSDEIKFNVREELQSLGSREAGQMAHTKILNLMDNYQTPVCFNFSGVGVISSSFADEVFGKLFAELGPLQFGNLCKFRNVEVIVQGLIDRAITQRLKG